MINMSMKNNIKKYSLMVLIVGSLTVIGCGDSSNKEELLEGTPIASESTKPTLIPSPEVTSSPNVKPSIEPVVTPTSTEEPSATPKIEENDTIPIVGEVDPTLAQEIVYATTNGIELPDGGAMSLDMFAETYKMPTDILSSYYVHIPIDSAYATEVAVFQMKSLEDKQEIMRGIENRQQGLLAKFKNASKEEYNIIQNYRTAEKEDNIIFVISKDADKIIEQFLGM